MDRLFLCILHMSLTASWVIAAVLLLRLPLRKAPKKWSYLLWSAVAFRLCCPVSFQSAFSLFNLGPESLVTAQTAGDTAEIVDFLPDYAAAAQPHISADVPAITNALAPVSPGAAAAAAPMDWLTAAAAVWLIGMAALLLFNIVGYARLRRDVAAAMILEGNVYQSDRVRSPFILGFIRPRIYIPFHLDAETRRYVLAHERYHIRRLDHLVKPFAFLLLTLHWFNPLCWLAFRLMDRDMEMSCDEKILADGGNIRKAYSTSLLSFAANRRFPAPSPLAFSESGVKSRVKNVLNWKKPRAWVTAAAAILCAAAIAVCATDPAAQESGGGTAGREQKPLAGRYASMDDFGQSYLHSLKTVTYYAAGGAVSSANVTDAKVTWMDKLGTVEGIHPDGALEVWYFHYLIQTDAEDVMLVGGMMEEDGWYDLEGQGGHVIVSLRYPDGSYDVLDDEFYNGTNFITDCHNTWSEALADWYITEERLDHPPYVDYMDIESNFYVPGLRYTGNGWYLYFPFGDRWELASVRRWTSSVGSGAYLTVQELEDGAQELMEQQIAEGWQPVKVKGNIPCVRHPEDAVEDYYYDRAGGGSYRVRIGWNEDDWWDDANRVSEAEQLRTAARSFTVDPRVDAANIRNTYDEIVFTAPLAAK